MRIGGHGGGNKQAGDEKEFHVGLWWVIAGMVCDMLEEFGMRCVAI
jgi:hypothetical protein